MSIKHSRLRVKTDLHYNNKEQRYVRKYTDDNVKLYYYDYTSNGFLGKIIEFVSCIIAALALTATLVIGLLFLLSDTENFVNKLGIFNDTDGRDMTGTAFIIVLMVLVFIVGILVSFINAEQLLCEIEKTKTKEYVTKPDFITQSEWNKLLKSVSNRNGEILYLRRLNNVTGREWPYPHDSIKRTIVKLDKDYSNAVIRLSKLENINRQNANSKKKMMNVTSIFSQHEEFLRYNFDLLFNKTVWKALNNINNNFGKLSVRDKMNFNEIITSLVNSNDRFNQIVRNSSKRDAVYITAMDNKNRLKQQFSQIVLEMNENIHNDSLNNLDVNINYIESKYNNKDRINN